MRTLAALSWLGACHGGGGDGTGPSDSGTVPLPLSSALVLDDHTTFAWSATADLPEITVQAGAPFVLDFAALSADVWGAPATTADVFQVELHARADTPAEIDAAVAVDGADPGAALEVWATHPDGPRVPVTDLEQTSFYFDPAQDEQLADSFLAVLTDADTRLVTAAIVHAGTGGSVVDLGDARITAAPTFPTATLATASDLGPWTLDWSGLTTDGAGRALDPSTLEQLFLVRVDDEADLVPALTHPERAPGYWTKYVEGTTALDPTELHDLAGEAFPGFTADGQWLFGLRCASCPTSVPSAAARVLVPR